MNVFFSRTLKQRLVMVLIAGVFVLIGNTAYSQDQEALAKQLANPIASLISVPIQLNYDENLGPGDNGDRYLLNVQPVIPITLNDDWNIISRTILPVISQDDVFPGEGSQSGIGDIVQSIFFSPQEKTSSGWIWGAGPVFLLSTASDELLGAEKWGAGPTAVALKQEGPWTYGALTNHVWSFAGDDHRNDVDATYLQPFLNYTTKNATTFTINSESTYDWEAGEWSLPVNLLVTQVTKVGDQIVSFVGGFRYWVDSTENGPEGLGVRLQITLLFPK